MSTSNKIINELLINGELEDESYYRYNYKGEEIGVELHSEQCIVYGDSGDWVTIQYNYSQKEINLCLNSLCVSNYYTMKINDRYCVFICCNGLIIITHNNRDKYIFKSDWVSLLPPPVYLSKTKSVLESISQDIDVFESRKNFIRTYNSMMVNVYIKGAHKI